MTWKVTAVGINGANGAVANFKTSIKAQAAKPTPKTFRDVFVHSLGGVTNLPIFAGNALGIGVEIEAPAVIEEETTTLFLLPNLIACTDPQGNYLVTDTSH